MLTKAMLILTLFATAATAHAHDGQPPKDTNCEAEYDRQGVVEALKVGDYNRLLEGAAKRAALSAWKGSGFVATVMRYVKSTDILVAVSTTDGGAAFVVQVSWSYSRDGELNFDKFSVFVEADGTAHALPLAPANPRNLTAEHTPDKEMKHLAVEATRALYKNGYLPGTWAGGPPSVNRVEAVELLPEEGYITGIVLVRVYASSFDGKFREHNVIVRIKDGEVVEVQEPGELARLRESADETAKRLEREAASNDNSVIDIDRLKEKYLGKPREELTEPSLNIPSPLDPRAGITEPPALAPVEERRAPVLSDAQQMLVSIARGGLEEEYNGHLPGIWAGGSPRIDRVDVRTVNYTSGRSGTVILDVYASNVTVGQSLYQVVVTIRDGRVEEISNPARMFAAQNGVPIIEEAPIEERVAQAVRKYILARSPNKRIGRTTVSEADRDSANPTFSVSVPVQTDIGLRGELYTVEVLPNGTFSIRAIGAQG